MPLQSAVLFPSPENPLLDLLSDPPEIQNLTLASIHSEALSMPTSSHCMGKEGTSESGSVDPGKTNINVLLTVRPIVRVNVRRAEFATTSSFSLACGNPCSNFELKILSLLGFIGMIIIFMYTLEAT